MELHELDKQESTAVTDEIQVKKEKITQGLAKLKERSIKYDGLQQLLDDTTDKQISTTDTDSRSILTVKNIVEVAYNTQTVVDDKHNLTRTYTGYQYQRRPSNIQCSFTGQGKSAIAKRGYTYDSGRQRLPYRYRVTTMPG